MRDDELVPQRFVLAIVPGGIFVVTRASANETRKQSSRSLTVRARFFPLQHALNPACPEAS